MVHDQLPLALFLLGTPRLEQNGRLVPINRRKVMALLAYLAVTSQAHSREVLATLFWPDSDRQQAYGSLRRCLSLAKKAVGPELLEITRETVRLNPDTNVRIDEVELDHCLTAIQAHCHPAGELCPDCLVQLTRATELVQGEFLAGFALPDAPQFDEWQFWHREARQQDFISVLAQLVAYHAAQAQPEMAISYARRWVQLEPLCESAQQQLISLYLTTGQQTAALRQYRQFVQQLAQELGQMPGAEITELAHQMEKKRGHARKATGERGPERLCPAAPASDLPVPALPFVGREREMGQLADWLRRPDCRLLTITGLGGVGKTRLALQAATGQSDQFADGIYFISLETAVSAAGLINALANSLPFSLPGEGASQEQLFNALRPQEALLLLDNFEQLTAVAPLLSRLLAVAHHLKLLVTSRRPLNLQEEWCLPLEGLPCPDADNPQAATYAAVQLFVQHARRQQPDFSLSPAELPHVIHICRQVAGLPLGIELAAGWSRTLSVADIAAEISRDPALLATSCLNVPERHHSLWVVCHHTWQLLSVVEQQALLLLTVFSGGFDREAVGTVAGVPLPLLRRLVAQSLLRCHLPGCDEASDDEVNGRYHMHPVVHQYAAARLAEVLDEQTAAQERHGRYYLDFLQQREVALQDHRQLDALAAIQSDLDNVRTAWQWAMTGGDAAAIDQGLAALYLFYTMKGFFWQGVADFDLEKMGHRCTRVNTDRFYDRVVGRLLVRQGHFYLRLSRLAEAAESWQRGLALLAGQDDNVAYDVALAQQGLGSLALAQGQLSEARCHYQACLATFKKLGSLFDAAYALTNLGSVACRLDELDAAAQFDREALVLFRELDNPLGMATCLNNLSHLDEMAGAYCQAEARLEESLALAQTARSHWLTAVSFSNLGHLATLQKRRQAAIGYYQHSLNLRQQHRLPGISAAQRALAVMEKTLY